MDININDYLRLNLVDIVLVCISTAILVMVAKHFFWDVILRYFDARKAHIAAQLQSAQEAKAEGDNYKERYHEQILQAKDEAQKIVQHTLEHAKLEKDEIIQDAKKEAKMLKESAAADALKQRAQDEKALKESICDIAFASAEKILEEKLSEQQKKAYTDQLVEQIGDSQWKKS